MGQSLTPIGARQTTVRRLRPLRLQMHRQRRRRAIPGRFARRVRSLFHCDHRGPCSRPRDVPAVQNIVFFKYVRSPIAFYQMVGAARGSIPRRQIEWFRVYDFTNATRLFGEEFKTKWKNRASAVPAPEPPEPPEPTIQVEGFDVRRKRRRALHRDGKVDGQGDAGDGRGIQVTAGGAAGRGSADSENFRACLD